MAVEEEFAVLLGFNEAVVVNEEVGEEESEVEDEFLACVA